jgi:hypothetical protein
MYVKQGSTEVIAVGSVIGTNPRNPDQVWFSQAANLEAEENALILLNQGPTQ